MKINLETLYDFENRIGLIKVFKVNSFSSNRVPKLKKKRAIFETLDLAHTLKGIKSVQKCL